MTQQSELENGESGESFAQHFASRDSVLKSRHQGLVQEGEVVSQSKLFLFNNNTRRVVNQATVIAVEFVLICAQIYSREVTASYPDSNIRNALPLLLHALLLANILYNSVMLLLQLINRKRHGLGKVESDSLQLGQSVSSQSKGEKRESNLGEKTKEGLEANDTNSSFVNNKDFFEGNKFIIKSNSTATSVYSLKRPQVKGVKRHRRNVAHIGEVAELE